MKLDVTEERRANLAGLTDDLIKIDPTELVRTGDLGRELDFSNVAYYFDGTRDLFKQLSKIPLTGLPPSTLDGCSTLATQYLSLIRTIRDYKATQGQALRDNLANQVAGLYQTIFNTLTPVIAYANSAQSISTEQDRLGLVILEATTEIHKKISEIEQVKLKAEKTLADAETSAQRSLESIQSAAAKSGVSANASFFKDEYLNHEQAAKNWLWAVIAAGAITATCAFLSSYLYIREVKPTDVAAAIQFAVAKIATLSVLYFFVVWCSRNYLATRHNATVNRHRAIALSTFETFVNASSDDATKNAVLLKATQAIFSPEVTGYLAKEPQPSVSPQLVEIFRGFSDHGH